MITISQLIDYLNQFPRDTCVVLSVDDIPPPEVDCPCVALDVAFDQFEFGGQE